MELVLYCVGKIINSTPVPMPAAKRTYKSSRTIFSFIRV
jgi:hypothetical protein